MKLYFYCSSGSLLEYFTINKIVCNDYLSKKNRKVIPSLGLASSKFLFLTPQKLEQQCRMVGFEKDYTEIGAVLEISITEEDAKNIEVLVVDKEGVVAESYSKVSELPEEYLGIFVMGEISFSYVTSIIFDNDNAKDDIYRPSKDLYFPEHLYSVVDDSFIDVIDTDKLFETAKLLDERSVELDVVTSIIKRNKITAIVLNTILETKAWPFGTKHKANFDDITAQLLGVSEKLDDLTEGMYSKLKDEELIDEILQKIDSEDNVKSFALFFKSLISELIPMVSGTFAQEEFDAIKDKIMASLSDKYNEAQIREIENKLRLIEELVYGTSNIGLEKLLSELPEQYAVLKALIFFLRSPQSALKLADGLSVYKAEPDTCRYAWIMFSALNGIEPISAEKTGNAYIMNIAERKAMEMISVEHMIGALSTENIPEEKLVLTIEEQVSAELVRELLLSDEYADKISDLIKLFASNKVLAKGFKDKNYKMIKNPFTVKLPEGDYIAQTEAEDIVAKIQEAIKKAKPQYDTEKFLADYIADEKSFSVLYKKDEDFWKRIYKNRNKK